ncbi:MAG TPA: response regulator [Polyangia bacterium]|jgi:CheY-like chemotaxis protein|nr:response regulator [Polyangia bacterium]
MSILIIEDDDGVRESLADILREEGYLVEVANGGEAALRRLTERPTPTLILLDLMMPQMDGVDFRRRQLADAELSKIPVVIISARPDVADQAQRLHADAFLRKPMSFEELLHVVQNRATTEVGAPE